MPRQPTRRRALTILAALLAAWAPAAPSPAQEAGPSSRQVTLFGVIATPGSNAVDPKLAEIHEQLEALLPGHGFRLVDVRSRRLSPGGLVGIDLRNGMVAKAQLVRPLDDNGKVELKVGLSMNGVMQSVADVTTPPNQLFFCDKELPAGERLLIGIGAR